MFIKLILQCRAIIEMFCFLAPFQPEIISNHRIEIKRKVFPIITAFKSTKAGLTWFLSVISERETSFFVIVEKGYCVFAWQWDISQDWDYSVGLQDRTSERGCARLRLASWPASLKWFDIEHELQHKHQSCIWSGTAIKAETLIKVFEMNWFFSNEMVKCHSENVCWGH